MGVRIRSFGGVFIWLLRKRYSGITSEIMLTATAKHYKRNINKYIEWFQAQAPSPLFYNVMVETLNRCNGKCAFCPANIHDEKREYAQMTPEIYKMIIEELKAIHWHGKLFLNVNNEPFVDVRIMEFARIARKELPHVKIAMITNATLLDAEKVHKLVGTVDELIINDYGERYKLSANIREIYYHIKKNAGEYKIMNVVINRRFSEEVLATRAGTSPNKPNKRNKINEPCIYPYTDLVIFPTGKIGLCCNDCLEVTDFGQVGEQSLVEIWQNEKFRSVRNAMKEGRSNYSFCTKCDVVDAGGREEYIKS